MFHMDILQFKRYKTCTSIEGLHTFGLPLSFVIVSLGNKYQLVFVVGNGASGCLLPFEVGACSIAPPCGFAYFQITVDYTCLGTCLYSTGYDGNGITHESVVNYGHLLPYLTPRDTGADTVSVAYAVVTTDANHMNASFEFV